MDFFDLHSDSPFESYKRNQSFTDGDLAVTLQKASVFDNWRQLCAIWVPDEHKDPKGRYRAVLNHFKGQVKIATTAAELQDKTAILLSLEGGAPIEEIEDVDRLFSDGIRVITLTWNGKNKIAGGANTAGEFTPFGKQVVRRMNELHMAVDMSHLCDRSFSAVLEEAKYPLATHSCCRSICHVRRNMTDEQILALARKGGIIGLCLYPVFLGDGNVFEAFYSQLCHLLFMGLEDYIAIGTDFDGAKMDKTLDSVDKMAVLYNYLRDKGLDDILLHKLFYKNAQDFFCALLNQTE